jgi:phospholipase/carboxylesterase
MTRNFLIALFAATLSLAGSLAARATSQDAVAGAPAVQTAALSRADAFAYHIVRPDDASGETIVLLHGSGGDENSLVKLASSIAPRATLIGIRGRITQEGRTRWYKRLTPVSFDQADIRAEAEAFASFLTVAAEEHRIDLDRALFLGYSNGANLIAAAALLHPGLIHRAALLRPMPVLDEPPLASLTGSRMLMVAGETDLTYAPFAPALEKLLKSCGAAVDARMIAADHGIGEADARLVAEWLAQTER